MKPTPYLVAATALLAMTLPGFAPSLAESRLAPVAPEPVIVADNDEKPDEAKPDDKKPDDAATPAPKPDPKPKNTIPPGTLRFHLMDGTIITGKLETQQIPVKTEFGELIVPITSITSFSPGLAAHPEIHKTIKSLIEQLSDPAAAKRDKAQAQLIAYGAGLVPELQNYVNDTDAERKVRIATIIETLYQAENDFNDDSGRLTLSLTRLDTIVTQDFTVAGHIQLKTFNIQSKFGKLVVNLADIKGAEQITSDAPEQRRTIDVMGTDIAGMRYRDSGIKLQRGDRVIITAEGSITLTPWGNNSVSSPDGIPQNGMYNGKIPFGGLTGRVGDKGDEFLIGQKKTFVADRAGTLYLGMAMQQNWANYQFPGKYETRIRVVPVE